MNTSCDFMPDRTPGSECDNETPILSKRKVLMPKQMNILSPDTCQPMKKRILAYTKLQEEHENIDMSHHNLPPLSSISLGKKLQYDKKPDDLPKPVFKESPPESEIKREDNKCSVIVRGPASNQLDKSESTGQIAPKAELQSRWTSALALMQLATTASPPSKKMKQ